MKRLSMQLLADVVVSRRKALGLTQAQVAKLTGIHRGLLSRLESKDFMPSVEQLQALYDKAVVEAGEDHAAIFEIHMMMLDDDDYLDSITEIINTQGKSA